MKVKLNENYCISDDIDKIDFKQVRDMLKDAFWSKNISVKEVKKGANNSALVVVTYDAKNKIVGYLRVISDKTRFAYILDVYVHEKHRKKEIGKSMMRFALNHPELNDVYQWLLATTSAPDFYTKLGFKPLQDTDKWMCIIKPKTKM